ncbi:MAG: signal peptide peptidase SppA [Campylobacterota bacterium]|nr:signal peptide peptidase SppA [Campylobacterota bacterium]
MKEFVSDTLWPITGPIVFIQRNFITMLVLSIIGYMILTTDKEDLKQPNLQTITLSGAIMNSEQVLEAINKAKIDKNIKGVLFKVNSPGGAVAPSVEIAYAIKELNSIKPVVAYASGTMASGSYYASIWASKIISNPGSMIGSIGVIMQSMDASELMANIGIKTQNIKIGTYKEVGTPTREWSQVEKEELNKVIKNTYDMFVKDVAGARGLKQENHKEFADAHIFTASQAKEVGLIDEVATISKAKEMVIKLSKVKNPIWQKEDKVDKFIDKVINSSIKSINNQMNSGLMAY